MWCIPWGIFLLFPIHLAEGSAFLPGDNDHNRNRCHQWRRLDSNEVSKKAEGTVFSSTGARNCLGRVEGENEDAPRKVLALVISLPSSPLPSHHPSKASLSRRNLWEKRSEDVVGRSSAVGRSSLELGRKLTAFLQEGEGDATPPIFSFLPSTSLGNPLRAAAARAFHLWKKSLFFSRIVSLNP